MANPLIFLVPEERIELSWAQGPRDFEYYKPAIPINIKINKLRLLFKNRQVTGTQVLVGLWSDCGRKNTFMTIL